MESGAEQWERVKSLFDAVLQVSPEQRKQFLIENCADTVVRNEVISLVRNHEAATGFLRPEQEIANAHANELAGRVIGRYHLVRRIGEGGMGEVWLAEQREPIRLQVALKLIKTGLNNREALLRFDSERQALALMDHPTIAKVFDAGATPEGVPYFVMEYVAGIPITEYCDKHRLGMRERLDLFRQVCEGVQHAHQKAIIHRDLKPSNILVGEVDGKAMPKIIDFGVAKALNQKFTEETMFTRAGVLVGTPEYMSPEQASSSGEDIDTRSDVFSLGIILYEMIAGEPPLKLRKVTFEEFLRRLREEDPEKPSTKISAQDPATSTDVARKRRTEPLALARELRGELDSIALKALEKERARRYGSASEFAADIKRYLAHEAVLAVPPSMLYRARKLARRHRVVLASASAIVLVLAVAAVVSIRQSIRASREAAVAKAVNEFLQNDLLAQAGASAQSGPKTTPDPDLKVRTALDRAAERIEGKFARQPQVEASIRDTIGWAYLDLGLYEEAHKQLERALELRRRTLGPDDARTLTSMARLGWVAYRQGKYPEAEALEIEAISAQRRVLGAEHPDTLVSMNDLASVYDDEAKYAKAEELHAQTLEIEKRVLGPEHPDTLRSMDSLANVYDDEGKYAKAEELHAQTLEIEKRVLGPEHPEALGSMNNLATVYDDEGNFAKAEELYGLTVEIEKRVLGPEHPDTLRSLNNLATVYLHERKYALAEALYSQNLEVRKRVFGAENPGTLVSMNNVADVYMDEGKNAQAEGLLTQTLEIQRRILGPDHPHVAVTLYNLGCVNARLGNKDRAIALLSQSVDHGLPPNVDLGIEKETDLASLRGDPRFAALVAHAKQVAEGKQRDVAQTSK